MWNVSISNFRSFFRRSPQPTALFLLREVAESSYRKWNGAEFSICHANIKSSKHTESANMENSIYHWIILLYQYKFIFVIGRIFLLFALSVPICWVPKITWKKVVISVHMQYNWYDSVMATMGHVLLEWCNNGSNHIHLLSLLLLLFVMISYIISM